MAPTTETLSISQVRNARRTACLIKHTKSKKYTIRRSQLKFVKNNLCTILIQAIQCHLWIQKFHIVFARVNKYLITHSQIFQFTSRYPIPEDSF